MAVDNQVVAAATSASIASLRSFQNMPEVDSQLHKLYGEGLLMVDFLHKSGRSRPMASDTVSGEEEAFTHRTMKLGTIVTNAAGTATVKIDADDFDNLGNYYPRVGFSVMVGNTIVGFTECRISSIDTTAAPNTVFTLLRYNASAVGLDAHVYAGTLATGIELPITASAFGVGTGQPAPTNVGTIQRIFYPQIIKESLAFEGRQLVTQKWVAVNGGKQFFNKELLRAEFLMDAQEEMMALMGQTNTANLTQTSLISNTANVIGKVKGLYTWAEELGGDILIGSTGMSIDDLDTAESYLISKGISDSVVALFGGNSAIRKLMKNTIAKVQGTSGGLAGSPFVGEIQDKLFGGNAISVNFNVQVIKGSSITFVLIPTPIFSNPKFMGVSTTLLDDALVVLPLNQSVVSIDRQKMTVPNFERRYRSMDGMSRDRIVGTLHGMDGIGSPIVSSIDGSNTYWLSDVCYTIYEAYRLMLVKRSS